MICEHTMAGFMDEMDKLAAIPVKPLVAIMNRQYRSQQLDQAKAMNPDDNLDRRTVRRFRKPNPRFVSVMTSKTKFSK